MLILHDAFIDRRETQRYGTPFMGDAKVLKGVFKEGSMMASVIQDGTSARVMLKGAEPNVPRDPTFLIALKKVAQVCAEHIANFSTREICAVLLQRPTQAEHIEVSADDIRAMGLTAVLAMDGDSGLVVRRCDESPPPTPLPYSSLRSGPGIAQQPGLVEVPAAFIRKTYRELNAHQQQVFAAAAQIARESLLRILCLEDEGLKLVVAVKDLPPARARSLSIPISEYAADLARGAPLEEIAKRLQALQSA